MALFDYNEMLAAAQELIAGAGRLVVFEKLTAVLADPERPWLGSGAPAIASSKEAHAAFVPLSSYRDLGNVTVNESLLQNTTIVGLVAGTADFDFSDIHSVTDNGRRYGVQWIDALKPGDVALLYFFGMKT